ncbi:unnamed protein product, partial [Closterium sp. Yama58-4]
MFGVLFPNRSFPLDVSRFKQVDTFHWVLEMNMFVGDAYDQVKEICIFLLSEAALPPGQALAVYVQAPGSPFEYRGASVGWQRRIEEMALKVGQNLFNYMQSFSTVQGNMLLVPSDILDRWFKKFQDKAKMDPDFLNSAAPAGGAAGGRGGPSLMGGALRLVQPHAPPALGTPLRTLHSSPSAFVTLPPPPMLLPPSLSSRCHSPPPSRTPLLPCRRAVLNQLTPLPLPPPAHPHNHPPVTMQVRGTDAANLAMTRVVQRDIWVNQFPGGSCADRRLLVVSWPPDFQHGVGSQVHVMTSFLSIAMRHNRTLVPDPLNYNRAYTDQCEGMGKTGQWECYFFPIVAAECERVVMAAKDSNSVVWGKKAVGALCASQHRVVGVEGMPYLELDHEATVALRWGQPHLHRPSTVWFPPGAAANDDRTPQ